MWIKYQKGQFQYKNFIINFDSKFELSKLSIFHNLKIEIGFWVDLMICMFGKLVKIMYSLMFCDKNKSQIVHMISNWSNIIKQYGPYYMDHWHFLARKISFQEFENSKVFQSKFKTSFSLVQSSFFRKSFFLEFRSFS